MSTGLVELTGSPADSEDPLFASLSDSPSGQPAKGSLVATFFPDDSDEKPLIANGGIEATQIQLDSPRFPSLAAPSFDSLAAAADGQARSPTPGSPPSPPPGSPKNDAEVPAATGKSKAAA